ncbi:MAG TPA: hypothetical protein VLX91_13205 [Candidatus Acidoferrales bacterium]|nr:hypothetical protein [Candidatus Acidoferrales bacterium]
MIFGIVDIIPMMFMNLPNRNLAMAGAFANRFAIGFVVEAGRGKLSTT